MIHWGFPVFPLLSDVHRYQSFAFSGPFVYLEINEKKLKIFVIVNTNESNDYPFLYIIYNVQLLLCKCIKIIANFLNSEGFKVCLCKKGTVQSLSM